jgi:hypothetical protein
MVIAEMILIVVGLFGLLWWGWSVWYEHITKPIPDVASPLGVRDGNYAQAVPAVGNKYSR